MRLSRKRPVATLMTEEEIEIIRNAAGFEGMSAFMRRMIFRGMEEEPKRQPMAKRPKKQRPAAEPKPVATAVQPTEADEHDGVEAVPDPWVTEPAKPVCPYCTGDLEGDEEIFESEKDGQRTFWHYVDGKDVQCGYPSQHWEDKIDEWKREEVAKENEAR